MSFEGEPAQCFTKSSPKARKSHRCCECRGWIEKDEVYERVTGVWDGSGYTFKTCRECVILRDRLNDVELKMREEPIPYAMVEEHIKECDDLESESGQELLRTKIKRGAPISRRWWVILKG